MAVREKHLTSIGMRTNKKGQVVATSPVMKDAEGLKEESGIICSICREGYHNQPEKVQGCQATLYTHCCIPMTHSIYVLNFILLFFVIHFTCDTAL